MQKRNDMKKILFFVFVFVFVNVCAEDYGIKVGGVSVTSSNCNNVTGSNIKAYKEGESYYVKYDPSTTTLTLKNVKIERTGSDNRAIYNTGCVGLTVVLDGAAYLYAKDAAPLRFETKTTVKCKNVGSFKDFLILGDQENAIYLTNGITLTFDSAAVIISGGSNSSAIEGKNATERIVVKNSTLSIGIDTGNEYYALRDIGSLQVQASAIRLIGSQSQSPVKNLKAFSLSSGTYVLPTWYGEIEYSSTKGTFVLKSSGEEYKYDIKISKAVPIDEEHFPDATFRGVVRAKINDTYIIPQNPLGVEDGNVNPLYIYDNTTTIKTISVWDKGITSLQGIEYLPHVQDIYCQNNSLTSLDLSKNLALRVLSCSNNNISSLKLPAIIKSTIPLTYYSLLSTIDCSKNSLTSLDLSKCSLLKEVSCGNNLLTSLKLPSSANELTKLSCENNRLTTLKMPADDENLTTLNCYGNRIKGSATTDFINYLYDAPRQTAIYFVDHSNPDEQNECRPEQCLTAKNGNWILYHKYNGTWSPTTGCPHYFNLTYKVDGEEYKVLSVLEGTTITPIAAPTKEGYTFSGWKNVPTTMPSNDVVVTGTFTINKYTLTYVVDGEEYTSQTLDYGATITAPETPTKRGYTFSGWEGVPATMPSNNVVVTGTFTINKYKLTYVVDGEVYQTYDITFGEPINPIDDPAPREGYSFSGWSYLPKYMPYRDFTISGWYIVKQYTITYIVDGEEYTSETLDYGATITAPEAPTKEGYTFSGWSEVPATMPAHNVTITATFATNPHTVTFYIDNEIFSTSILGYGAEIQLPEVPDKVGYTFGGWKDVATTMPDHDLEYHAWYEAISYNLTYYIDGVIYKITRMKYGDPITHEEDPEDDDYFYAWEDEPTTMPNHDVDVHAVVTGIQGQESRVESQESDIYYDLQGHKVTNPVKGNIYIRNKKKIVY